MALIKQAINGTPYLTLTSVVFELNKRSREEIFVKNLTLTSVVFE